ncbi:MAG: hypothetical protein M0036_20095 [Desulfobacteraceae bacterium]|nr:hypothetical protein [Desulfobacteraceae bacterium]
MHRFVIRSRGVNRALCATLGALCILAVVGPWSAVAAIEPADAVAPGRADIVIIDGLKSFGPLERAPVVFLHDRHTEAMAKQGKDCLACHLMDKERLSLKFQRLEELNKQSVMDLYHTQCVACHKEYGQRAEKTGPITCGECHAEKKTVASIRQPLGLDRSLHYRHAKANEDKCERCHHEYNAQTKTLYYAKGREGACLYCHKEKTEENRISNRLASHMACIGCHRTVLSQKKKAGPIMCGGCHDPRQQALIAKVEDPPRLMRNQPDAVLVKVFRADEITTAPQERLSAVPFDHKSHEGYANQCRTCHHAALSSCAHCHTIQGHKDGQMVKLAQAMHQRDAIMSCVGCHRRKQEQPECYGCHGSIPAQRVWSTEAACRVCHVSLAKPLAAAADEEQTKALAAEMIAARRQSPAPVAVEDIPETVSINHLMNQFEAVKMPHRKILLALAENAREDRLASAFHSQSTTLCQGCHHNSPSSLKPPQCGACHGRTSDALNLTRPGLMAAFHQQCLECHQRMGIEKPAPRDCAACHAKRGSQGLK